MAKHTYPAGSFKAVIGPHSIQPQKLYWGLVCSVECSPEHYMAVVTDPPRAVGTDETEDITRLLGASPDLAEALRSLIDAYSPVNPHRADQDAILKSAWAKANAALQKAGLL